MKLKVGIIGLGYWGPNYVRNFIANDKTEAIWACDLSEELLKKIGKYYPHLKLTTNYQEILMDTSIDLIAIATPPNTHYKITKDSLSAGKHVVIAKPLATKLTDAKKLRKLAKEKNLLLHCDLTYLYTPAIREIKHLISNKKIGEPLYYDSTRSNLGLIQKDVNVIWDLALHDIAILSYLFNLKPIKIFCTGSKHHGENTTEEMAHVTIHYTNNFIAHIHVSWISPVKLRTILIGGSKKMIFYNDIEPDEKIKIYDKGVDISSESITTSKPVYRSGDVVIPRLDTEEALYFEIEDISKQIQKNKIEYANANLNIDIINLLEACDQSLKRDKPVTFEP